MRDIEVLLVAELDKMTSLEPKGPKLHESKLRAFSPMVTMSLPLKLIHIAMYF